MTDTDGYRYCDRCGVLLTEDNNKCGYEICDECNEKLERKYGAEPLDCGNCEIVQASINTGIRTTSRLVKVKSRKGAKTMDKTVSNPIGLTREMLGIDQAVIAGRNKSIEDVKDYIAKELEAEYQRGYQDGLQHLSHPAEKARHTIIKRCLKDIMNTIDATAGELQKALEDL